MDLDGTLLHSNGNISEYTLEALQECKRRGVLVVVATVRFWFKAENLDIILPDYTILADGTQIYHNAMGNAIDEVKEAADIVIESNDEDGIAKYLEKMIRGCF